MCFEPMSSIDRVLSNSLGSQFLNPLWWAFRLAEKRLMYSGGRRKLGEFRNEMLGPLIFGQVLTCGIGGLIAWASGSLDGMAAGILVPALFALCPSAMAIMVAWGLWWRMSKPDDALLPKKDALRLVRRAWLPTWALSLTVGVVLYVTR